MDGDGEQTFQAVSEARRHIAASIKKAKKANTPRAQREAVIEYLEGVSILARELGGVEYTGPAIDVIGALEDLNQGIPNMLFTYRKRGKVGRPLKSLQRDAYMAYACAAVDASKPPYGELAARIIETANQFRIGEKSLRSFRKKLTSNEPPSKHARVTYDQLLKQFSGTDMTWREIVGELAIAAAGCFRK